MIDGRKRYALVGTGSRAEMYIDALSRKYSPFGELVGLCDLSQTRMNYYNQRIQSRFGMSARPTYKADQFDQMVADTKPDIVIVMTMESAHHLYIRRAMELGCDVITEKPLTIDIEKLNIIYDAIERTGFRFRSTINFRHSGKSSAQCLERGNYVDRFANSTVQDYWLSQWR